MTAERLVRVVAPHFVAGLVIQDGLCVQAAPILRWAVGMVDDHLRRYFATKGWQAAVVPMEEERDGRSQETESVRGG